MITELRHLPAPAKLNLFLHVTGRRADGYHLLETVFELIDLCDRLHLKLRTDGQIFRATTLAGVDASQDLGVRAARLLADACGTGLGVEIRTEKRIPMGGGLGGGSSDAATVLLGLNRLWNLNWPTSKLATLAARLGADVPFFLFGRSAYATGIGDKLRALPMPQRHYLLVAPRIQVRTQEVFSAPELTRNTKPVKLFGLLRGGNVFRGRNDLQSVVLARQPKVVQALEALRQAAVACSLDASLARMTGSGSCLFLPTASESQARLVCDQLHGQLDAELFVTRSLPVHPLRDWAFRARLSRQVHSS
ncbi:MAG: 4-(cytidine 5'-diphospho)-2-C-methyl-D-erythritol kinase [Quisquiliibacterium sp.]